jgi:hypothetical protein
MGRRGLLTSLAIAVSFASMPTAAGDYISHLAHYSGYHPDLVRYTVSKGEMPVIVLCAPYAESDIVNLPLPPYLPNARFKPITPDAAATTTARMVLAFNATGQFSGTTACRNPQSYESEEQQGNFSLWAAFCYREEVLAEGRIALSNGVKVSVEKLADPVGRLLVVVLTDNERIVDREDP